MKSLKSLKMSHKTLPTTNSVYLLLLKTLFFFFLPPLLRANAAMTRDGVRPATWRPVCLPLPFSPLLLTTSGYTCSGEFRFQTERCLSLVFCRTSITSKHILSFSGPVVREGEPLTACYIHTLSNLTRSCFLPPNLPHP